MPPPTQVVDSKKVKERRKRVKGTTTIEPMDDTHFFPDYVGDSWGDQG
jgi:hypothetical protein